ncbi:uncharacterized protein N7446_005979 [Penicillium canescens]|nr:uncharacterized protein N7446_005979 [Penicillium canescens]KAJ6061859.1 hypothetical protein N7446_005979 [Penicillium canescens]KAJ6065109.1 hypothetical protein N7444_000762 [Penicillium canescens]
MLWVLKQGINPIPNPTILHSNSIGFLFISILSATYFLLANPKDSRDFVNANGTTKSFFSRLYEALRIMMLTRAINTPRQVKNVPGPPAYYAKRDPKVIPRGRFLVRETSIAVWQFLALSMFETLSAQEASKKPAPVSFEVQWFVPVDQWVERIISNVITWFVVARILIDLNARICAILCVGLGLDTPADSPPTFRTMADAYSLRNFWGKFWHQLLRQPFTSLSNFIARDVLCLPRSSLVERYTNVFIVCFFSGLLHLLVDILGCVPAQGSGSMFFFLSFVLGFMIEDGVKAMWKSMYPQAKESAARLRFGKEPLDLSG